MRLNLWVFFVVIFISFCAAFCQGGDLEMGFYRQSCSLAEELVRDITLKKVAINPTLPAALLRMHFHDCFVQGCDGSILLDSVAGKKAEKDAPPNLSLAGFDVIDEIKSALEATCPGVVSCADILALAARDAVSFQYGRPPWEVLTGRRDGRVSLASEVNLPSPFADFATLQQQFADKDLDITDLVALSGAHTLGVGHCGLFANRLYNFAGKGDADPSLNPFYASFLKRKCPKNFNRNTTVEMDPRSSHSFDSNYFRIVTRKMGLFQSDAALLTNPKAARLVRIMQIQPLFFAQFGHSMKKMGAIGVLTGQQGEIRKQCRVVNH